MAALNLSCCYHHHHFQSHSPPPTNVPILLSHRNNISISPKSPLTSFHHKRHHSNLLVLATTMATNVQEDLPPALDSTSEPPSVFDGTTRLYISYTCPYAQRVWITRNCKGLQEKIKLVPIDLKNRPDWYKEKVYPANKVPALEHNNQVKGESLDLIKYIDTNFEGPSLYPDDTIKQEFGEELLSYTNTFYKAVTTSLKGDGFDDAAAAFDYIEKALSKFDDGPFFLGQFSLVDIAYAPFIERFQPYLLDVKKYDIKVGRPKLAVWIEEMNKNDDFNQTRRDPKELVESYRKRYLSSS
ncbi:putative glutathione transferase [Helianthus annuus]|uniref:glutathione transferase n=1 Tax=Helianthus annuus TaxID=4232 RepID=A0A0N9HM59_HELAN|nr:glutathione S-transferase L3 isoform X2 [Helianthus annuus]ALG05156.1 glutathione S-transferase [Helianthus annuus]KAJ0465683.1 putative glutathione transferase [Helianthus annuus]KAJ0470557.1 putative glutathione transferase [Helianthus annuus]KAJ0487274.1 putative glutathione transferase [Helianthus annuus]KAJ0661384.1 putative glutathione transferase [Helianthus annuus]